MTKNIFTLSTLCILLAAFPAWGVDLNPGKYEITVKVEMPGMPGMMPPQTSIQCLDKQNLVPNSSAKSQGCEITDMNTKGNTVTYTMKCNQQGTTMTSNGKMTYSGNSINGTVRTAMGPEAGGMTVTTMINGKRIGKCD